jgi:hypothetical protein
VQAAGLSGMDEEEDSEDCGGDRQYGVQSEKEGRFPMSPNVSRSGKYGPILAFRHTHTL